MGRALLHPGGRSRAQTVVAWRPLLAGGGAAVPGVTCGSAVPWGPQGRSERAVASTLREQTRRARLCVSEALVTPDTGARLEAGAPSAVGAPAEGQPPAPVPLVSPGSGTREGLQGLAVHTCGLRAQGAVEPLQRRPPWGRGCWGCGQGRVSPRSVKRVLGVMLGAGFWRGEPCACAGGGCPRLGFCPQRLMVAILTAPGGLWSNGG